MTFTNQEKSTLVAALQFYHDEVENLVEDTGLDDERIVTRIEDLMARIIDEA